MKQFKDGDFDSAREAARGVFFGLREDKATAMVSLLGMPILMDCKGFGGKETEHFFFPLAVRGEVKVWELGKKHGGKLLDFAAGLGKSYRKVAFTVTRKGEKGNQGTVYGFVEVGKASNLPPFVPVDFIELVEKSKNRDASEE